jgi:hypothetical protein
MREQELPPDQHYFDRAELCKLRSFAGKFEVSLHQGTAVNWRQRRA